MRLKMYQVDAFASRVFEGNPAAVVPLDGWLDDTLMQAIAEENNLSETAFFVPGKDVVQLRWFTPRAEVDLCGHATLAAAHVLFHRLGHRDSIRFSTRSGELVVRRRQDVLEMALPATVATPTEPPAGLVEALGRPPAETFIAFDIVAVYEQEADVREIVPDFVALRRIQARGVVVTSPGEDVDFVSRCFYPRLGVDEDPVTGSAHCILAPLWGKRLKKDLLVSRQLSSRGGWITCSVGGDEVLLAGTAQEYMVAEIDV